MATLILGTRGSALALWQARWVESLLRARHPGLDVEIVVIRTTGDARQDVPLSAVLGRGVFVREIEAALLDRRIDLAVHSAKDLPSEDRPGLTLAAFCERGDPRDALVSPRHGRFADLPAGALVATSSPRRIAQLRHARPDLRFTEIRGNVDTRLEKLARGDADALVLAVAGLARLGRQSAATETLEPELCLPQVGQACVAVQCRADDAATVALVAGACDHPTTRREVSTERAFLARLGGGCTAPVAAFAIGAEGTLNLFALAARADGSLVLKTRARSTLDDVQGVVTAALDDLMARGAREILETEGAPTPDGPPAPNGGGVP
jgi:hydroxymethylbilane synthase